jgi:predicted GNAT family N-acyltransferase
MEIEVKSPTDWPRDVLGSFEGLVRAGGEVAGAGLPVRITEAKVLACHFVEGQLAAIAALKNPKQSYRAKILARSGFDLDQERYPYELGWVFVVPQHRGARLSRPLVKACLASANNAGVFATTRQDNEPMQRTLKRYGFAQAGDVYKSERGDASLVLFLREGVQSEPSTTPNWDGI